MGIFRKRVVTLSRIVCLRTGGEINEFHEGLKPIRFSRSGVLNDVGSEVVAARAQRGKLWLLISYPVTMRVCLSHYRGRATKMANRQDQKTKKVAKVEARIWNPTLKIPTHDRFHLLSHSYSSVSNSATGRGTIGCFMTILLAGPKSPLSFGLREFDY